MGGRWCVSTQGGGPAGPKVVTAFGGRLCRRVVFQGAKKGSEGSKGSEGKVDGAFGPEGCIEGLCSLCSGGDSPIGLKVVDCPSGNDYEVSVTGIAFCYINRAEHSAELATCVATPYPAAPDSPLFRGENRLLYTFL